MNSRNYSSDKGRNWFSQVILDVLVTGFVILSAFWMPALLKYLLYAYSILLLLMRVISLFNRGMKLPVRKEKVKVPEWFYHINYFICTVVFFISMQYLLGILWIAIWLLSWISTRKLSGTMASR